MVACGRNDHKVHKEEFTFIWEFFIVGTTKSKDVKLIYISHTSSLINHLRSSEAYKNDFGGSNSQNKKLTTLLLLPNK